jgi:ABC-type glycerol-3-phosphate transport system substrate-binding protein
MTGRRSILGLPGALALIVMVAACGSGPISPSAPRTTATRPSVSPWPSPSPSATPAGIELGIHTIPIRWFVSLPADASADQIAVIETVVADFDGEQLCRVPQAAPVLSFSVEIVPDGTASQILRDQITAGNPPDLVGPVTPAFLAASGGSFDELTPFASLSSDLRFAAIVRSKTHDRILEALTFLANREDLAGVFSPDGREASASPTRQVHRWPYCS